MTTTTNPDARPARRDGARPWLWGVALLVLLCVPLVVALVYLHHPRWYPLLDWAQTEIRIRDISHGHPPLIGLAGRIGPLGADGGSHPGPLSFYLLWPVWQLLGGAAYGMYVGTVVLDVVAVGLCLWIAQRRGGLPMLVSGALVLAVLMRAYGAYLLTLPWNPYLPVLWWCVVLLAVWSLLCDDLAMLPVAAFAGTFCVQTHISYLGLVGGLGVLAVTVVGVRAIRGGRDRRRAALRFGLLALGILVVLWIPPVVDEILHHPGNLTTIRDYFSNPPDAPIGMRHGLDVLLTRLNPARLFGAVASTDGFRTLADGVAHGSRWPGALTIVAWLASVAGAWRLRAGRLLRLDAVIGATLVLGAVSSARIFGPVWFYLLLWAIPILALMLATIAWTVVSAVQARDRAPSSTTVRAAYTVGIVGIVVATGIATFWAVDNVAVMSPRMNAQLAALSKPTVAELHRLARAGGRGPVYVSWQPEPQNIGAEGYGLLDELLRHGFDVKADPSLRPGATRAHVLAPDRMATQVHLAIGPDLERWRRDPRFREIAYDDPRSPAERAKSDRLRARAVAAVRRDGRTDLLDDLQDNTFVLLLKDDLPDSTQQVIARMLRLGLPAAVFVGPVADPPR